MPQNITIRTQRPYVDPMPFQLPQYRTPSDQVNQAGSEAVKDIKSYADPLSGAKLNLSLPNQGKGEWWKQTGDVNAGNAGQALNTAFGLSDQTRPVLSDRGQVSIPQAPQVNTALPSNDSHIPATTTNEKETNDIHPENLAWGQNKEAADYVRNATNPSATMRAIQADNAEMDRLRRLKATEPVHGGRKIAAIAAGIATGILGGGIPGGIGAYQQVAHGPTLANLALTEQHRKDLIEQEKLQETEFGRGVQQGSAMAGVARTSADIMKEEREKLEANRPQLTVIQPSIGQDAQLLNIDKNNGKVISQTPITGTAHKETSDFTPLPGVYDGKEVVAHFDHRSGKTLLGNKDISNDPKWEGKSSPEKQKELDFKSWSQRPDLQVLRDRQGKIVKRYGVNGKVSLADYNQYVFDQSQQGRETVANIRIEGAERLKQELDPKTRSTFNAHFNAYQNTAKFADDLISNSGVLNNLLSAGKVQLAVGSDGSITAAATRGAKLSDKEIKVVSDFTHLAENINTLRGPLGATGFRGHEAFSKLQGLIGKPLQDPRITRQVLEDTLGTIGNQMGPIKSELTRAGESKQIPKEVLNHYLRAAKNNPEKAHQLMIQDGWE